MKRTILFSLFTILACGSMQATTFNFGYGENGDASNTSNGVIANGTNGATARTWTIGGITVNVQAFTLLNTPAGSMFSAADTTQFGVAQSANNNLGIGVCNSLELAATGGCGFNEWQIDDKAPGGADFLLFTFSQAVNIGNLVIHQTTVQADSDAAYFASNAVYTTPSTAWGLTTDAGGLLNPGQSRTLLGGPGIVGIRTFLFGAKDSGDGLADYFKLVSLDVTASSTPEPGTMAMLGSGLVALGIYSRRKKS
ncbi:MAG: PEP-CTERM sorting domain-containing protein [Acidobacteriota bacterium]